MVLDTGVLISAFAFGGIPERAVKKALAEGEIYVSAALLEEYRDVPLALETLGKIDHNQMKALISAIAAFVAQAKIVEPKKKFAMCRDPEDNMLLECAHEAKAQVLISGDKDLLKIQDVPFQLKILSPRKYLEQRT